MWLIINYSGNIYSMIDAYRGFFGASATASAAFIGLLFVAVTFIDSEKVNDTTQRWMGVVATSSFAQLVNVFFISLVGLLPGARDFAIAGVIMSILGILIAFKLLAPALNGVKPGRRSPTALGLLAVGAYILQLVASIGLVNNPNNQTLIDLFIAALLILFAGALLRAWGLTSIRKH